MRPIDVLLEEYIVYDKELNKLVVHDYPKLRKSLIEGLSSADSVDRVSDSLDELIRAVHEHEIFDSLSATQVDTLANALIGIQQLHKLRNRNE